MTNLPSAKQLERLPVRAVLAYAARAARRMSVELRGTVEDETFQEALSIAESVASAARLDQLGAAAGAFAAARVAGTLGAIATRQGYLAALSIMDVAGAASNAVLAAVVEKGARESATYVARAAEQAASRFDILEEPMAAAAIQAARRDYEILLRNFGEHEAVVIGDPIDLSESSLLGPLWPPEYDL